MRVSVPNRPLSCLPASFYHHASYSANAPLNVSFTRNYSTSQQSATASLPPRWLSEVKTRVGKCITFGMNNQQTKEATVILESIARDWRELVAGSEGFLTAAGHVNNVVYNRYAESGRVLWSKNYATHIDPTHKKEWKELMTSRGVGLILRSIKTDFKFPMTYPDRVTVYHKLATEPTSATDSFVLDVLILSELHQRPAARCVEDIVVYDYQKAKKAPLKPFMVDAFRETWRLQEEAKVSNSERVHDLLKRVRSLEQETWDRSNAVENMGSVTR
ncbi:hypothetical protein KVT40_001894 [Elsinoe batatas]|uniref:Thioesterase/thiol ester dehydrase-isomerase n=1 Tax=Elsinoe batatas TaxID=2601811 RepID=A0A8K0L7J5_9PEZI|nr:hypothetical protein KVT40_001894 [Elsinoe batatas]